MIDSIRLQNFRSYSDETFEFSPGVNIIVGPNASGKTNMLEGVLIACTGRSYKGKDSEFVKFNTNHTKISVADDQKKRIIFVENTQDSTRKKYEINGQKLTRLSLDKTLPVVLFQPEHLRLVSGSPQRRRDFLDDLLGQTIGGFNSLRNNYKRTLAQRNKLLKQNQRLASKQLFAWNIRLSELAGEIVKHRIQLVEAFNKEADSLYKKISSSKKSVELNYQASCPIKNYPSQLLKYLEKSEQKDFLKGFTSHGPHREDMQILLDGHSAQESASRGESRTLVLVLKIMELKNLEESYNKPPIILLDDVFSELDGARRRTLTTFLNNYQTFITTTDADIVVHHFMGKCNIIPLSVAKT